MLFNYTALNKEGVTEKDSIEASNYAEAVRLLHSRGLIPTDVRERGADPITRFLTRISGVSLQDKILFIENLGIMLKAGISITRALKILANQSRNPKFKEIMQKVYSDVESGKTLADSLAQYDRIFPTIFISMIRVGESTGTLEKGLEYLGIQLQREHQLVSKTKGALIYPAVIVGAVVIVGILMSIFVLPSLTSIFKDSGVELPLTTKIVIGFVDFMSQHTVIALGIIIAFFGLAWTGLRTKTGSRYADYALLYVPTIGEIDKKINLARFARIMSSMLKSGTPILEGLEVAQGSLGNAAYREALTGIAKNVRDGKTLAISMENSPKLFNFLVTQMVGVGEESGNVEAILEEIANHYEEEVDDTMKNVSSIIEPLLLLFIGGVVGVLAVALIGPIYSMTQAAGQ